MQKRIMLAGLALVGGLSFVPLGVSQERDRDRFRNDGDRVSRASNQVQISWYVQTTALTSKGSITESTTAPSIRMFAVTMGDWRFHGGRELN
jgi:hypothetical protein